MYLEKLEIQGFKSFASHTQLVFRRELTAVVGPNGSGKSNIADAVRWVLGEQSSKTLRGKKAEDVIFVGSDKKARLGFAQVSLYLNNADHAGEIDYEQIIITRKIDRNGESEYLINNNKVRLFDVQLLLAKANFGQKTYSVIGQGMVDSILVSSAAERKEFFDEATGVRQFQIKKEQAISKLENARVNLAQTQQIMSELEPHLRSLTRQVRRLEKRERVQTELLDLQTKYYNFLNNNLNQELLTSRHKHDSLQKAVSDLNQKLVNLQTSLEAAESGSSRQSNFDLLQRNLSQAQNEINNFLKEKAILEGQADLKLLSTGQGDIVWIKKRLADLENILDKNTLQLETKQHKYQQVKIDLANLLAKQESIVSEFKKLENLMSAEQTQIIAPEHINKEIDYILKQQQQLQVDLEQITSLDEMDGLRKLCQQVTTALKNLWQKLQNDKNHDRHSWQKEFNKLLTSKDTLVAEISEAKTKVAILEHEIENLNKQLAADKEELVKLDNDRKYLLARSFDNQAVRQQLASLQEKIHKQSKAIKEIEEEIRNFNATEEANKQSLLQSQKSFRVVQQEFNEKNSQLNEIRVSLARLETRQEDLQKEIAEEIPNLSEQKVSSLDLEEARQQINNLKNQLQIIGGIDPAVVAEYNQVNERYTFLKEQTTDLAQATEHLEKIIKDLDEAISEQFDQSFRNINKLFDGYFKKLFSGGKAELILDIKELREEKNSEDEDGEAAEVMAPVIKKQYGIEIKATPPGKRLSSINMLSGGEKALTSIALICAIIANNPSPFVVLDEVDAALDEANSIRFSQILDELSSKTQFVAITHNRATMHRAKIIYGVTMGDDGVSKLISINFDEADKIAA
ncbi:MAG: AAA family ATPase [Patescibacteria group bacterium]